MASRRGFLGALAALPFMGRLFSCPKSAFPARLADDHAEHDRVHKVRLLDVKLNDRLRDALGRHEARVRAQAQRVAQEAVNRFYEDRQW